MAPAGPNTPELILLERIAAGDSGAFSELGGRHRQEMLSVASVIAGPDAAEDAVQKALIDAHRWLAKGESPDDVGAWLRTIARNRALDELRTAARSPKLPAPTPVASPHETIERRDTIRGVLAGVRSLPALQRAAILAQAMEGKSHAEIAAEHGVSTGAVRAAIPRARRNLRGWMGALIPLPLLGLTRRALGRVRDMAPGGAAGATAGLATVAVAAAVSAGLVGGTGPEGDLEAAEPPSAITAGLNQASPQSESARSATRSKRPERSGKSARSGGTQSQSPITKSAPAAPSPATPSSPDPPTPSPPDPPAPTEPPPEPPTPPTPVPPPPAPPPPAPAGACGSLTTLVPCVLETVHGALHSLP